MKLGGGVHLTYCSNIHPGESWAEVRENLARHVPAVRERVRAGAEFGIGLRLSARAAAELAAPGALAEFQQFLRRERLYVFTVNGFPYGPFHGTRVKEEVYLPDWRDPARLLYSNQLADLLAALLPDEPGLEGSVSTVPGAFKAALGIVGEVSDGRREDLDAIVEHLLRHVAHLLALRERSGRTITLALEPEPLCLLETIDEVVDFFGRELHTPAAARRLAALTGLDEAAAATGLRTHLGLCLDLCHAAVEFEDAADGLRRLRAAGIRVLKMQISAGLRLPRLDRAALTALRRFGDAVYLHQVVQRGPQGLSRFDDLPAAFATLPAAGEGGSDAVAPGLEWRVHFHVPIFHDTIAPFASTQDFIREVMALQRAAPVSAHLEVETYTWDVLPEALRAGGVDAAVARELAWVRAELGA